jgi:hypothetical protein
MVCWVVGEQPSRPPSKKRRDFFDMYRDVEDLIEFIMKK